MRRGIFAFLLVLSGCSVEQELPKQSVKVELPGDLTQIKALTAEQAQALVEKHKPKGFSRGPRGHGWRAWNPAISEKELREDLKRYAISEIALPSLASVTQDVAKCLSATDLTLDLSGLTELSPESAAQLALCRGNELKLRGLKTISDETAKALSRYEGHLYLDGLTELSEKGAEALAQHVASKHSFFAEGMKEYCDKEFAAAHQKDDSEEFQRLFKTMLAELSLNGLTTLTDGAAKAIAKYKGIASLTGLRALSIDARVALRDNPNLILPDSLRAAVEVNEALYPGAAVHLRVPKPSPAP